MSSRPWLEWLDITDTRMSRNSSTGNGRNKRSCQPPPSPDRRGVGPFQLERGPDPTPARAGGQGGRRRQRQCSAPRHQARLRPSRPGAGGRRRRRTRTDVVKGQGGREGGKARVKHGGNQLLFAAEPDPEWVSFNLTLGINDTNMGENVAPSERFRGKNVEILTLGGEMQRTWMNATSCKR